MLVVFTSSTKLFMSLPFFHLTAPGAVHYSFAFITKHENRQTMKAKDRCFCEEIFIDRSFLVLEISYVPWLN